MIENLKELKSILRYEKTLYPNHLYDYLTLNQRVYNWRFVRALRWAELFHSKMKSTKNPFYGLLYLAVCRKKIELESRSELKLMSIRLLQVY